MDIDSTVLLTDVTTALVEDTFKGAWGKVKKFFADINAKDAIKYGRAYEKYLINTECKNSKIKTIIYRRAPKDLYSFYECIGVAYNGNIISTKSILNLISINNKIIITGTGGIGKSILFKHLFLNSIYETDYIPVLIELRSINNLPTEDISICSEIYKNLSDNGFKLSEEYFDYSMKKGAYIILFDGFDELNRDKALKTAYEIKSLSDKYNENKYLISSRPSDEFIGWNDFSEMTSLQLTKEQAINLIGKIEFDESVKTTFSKELDTNLYDKYKSFASNPLLLNIMLLTFQKHASIPDKLNNFYEEAFVTLFNAHDATKDSYVRDIRTGLGCEDFKLLFSYICFKSYFKDEYEFSEAKLRSYLQEAKEKFDNIQFSIEDFQNDLTKSVCMLVKDGLNYRFSHRSFQEYFAAWYTCKLTDDTQSKLLTGWLKESDSIFTDSYFNMLFDLQSEKVNKIVLCPALKLVQIKYNELGYSMKFLNELFDGIVLRRRLKQRDKREYTYDFSLSTKDRYLCYSLMLNCRLNSFGFSKRDKAYDEKLYKALDGIKHNKTHWSFEEVLKAIPEDQLLECFSWFDKQVLFSISTIEKYDDSSLSRKRKVSSIIDEL